MSRWKQLVVQRRGLLAYTATALAGGLLALLVYRLWSLQKTSHFVLVAGVLGSLGFAAPFVRRLPDLLFVAFVLCVPITGLFKTFFLLTAGYDDRLTAILLNTGGVIGVGPIDIVLLCLYAVWAFEIVVTRKSTLPKLQLPDAFAALLMAAYVLSSLRAPERAPAWFSIVYQVRFVLAYFFISRRIRWGHLPIVLALVSMIGIAEATLAVYQYSTGKLTSLILDRGSGANLNSQYEVPGIEHRNRATGTCNESHTFGLFMAILAQLLSVGMFYPQFSPRFRSLMALAFLAVMMALLCSFSRSAWLAAAIALSIVWLTHLLLWGERQVLLPTVAVLLVGVVAFPWVLTIVVERFTSAEGTVAGRFEQFPIAWQIWKDHFVFGYGAGNYMWALDTYNKPGVLDLPVHNVFLWIGAELGLVGVIGYFGLVGVVLWRALSAVRAAPHPVSRIGLAVVGCLTATLFDGLSDPLYREPVVYMMFWLMLGVGVSLARLRQEWDWEGVATA